MSVLFLFKRKEVFHNIYCFPLKLLGRVLVAESFILMTQTKKFFTNHIILFLKKTKDETY